MNQRGKIIVLANDLRDVIVVSPQSLNRVHGVVGRGLMIAEDVSSEDRLRMLEAVVPCFATVRRSPDSGREAD